MQAIASGRPGCQRAGGDDQPELPVGNSTGGIAGRRLGPAIGVAVIMAEHGLADATRLAVGAQQSGGVDLEATARVGRDIGRRHRRQDASGLSQQQPATLPRVRPGRCVQKCVPDIACNRNDHPNIG